LRSLAVVLLLGVTIGLSQACGSDAAGPSTAVLDGSWAGNGSTNGTAFSVIVTLAETTQGITGHGTISGSGPTCTLAISGTRQGSRISLTLTCGGFQPFTFVGTERTATRIEGTFEGSGVPSTPLALRKV
jgi:hypothetical protein